LEKFPIKAIKGVGQEVELEKGYWEVRGTNSEAGNASRSWTWKETSKIILQGDGRSPAATISGQSTQPFCSSKETSHPRHSDGLMPVFNKTCVIILSSSKFVLENAIVTVSE
jgi:hypothetical protein